MLEGDPGGAMVWLNALADRALIEAQLANPPEVWWSLDELSEGEE
jgi:hypothetical protein